MDILKKRKSLVLPGFEPQIVQPCYSTNYAIPYAPFLTIASFFGERKFTCASGLLCFVQYGIMFNVCFMERKFQNIMIK